MEFLISDKVAFAMLFVWLVINLITTIHMSRNKNNHGLATILYVLIIWLIPVLGVLFYWLEYIINRWLTSVKL